MWGDRLRAWFELFAGIVVYRVTQSGPDSDDGWINVAEIERRFINEHLIFGGKPYDPSDVAQRNALLESLITNASALCDVRLLARRRNISPPSLDYCVTKLGRRVDSWGYGARPSFRKRLLFFCIALFFRLHKYRKVIAIGAVGWGVLNAVKFYSAAFDWLSGSVFGWVSAVAVLVLVWLIGLVHSLLGNK